MRTLTFKSEQAKRKIDRIRSLTSVDPKSLQEIASETFMSVPWARSYVQHLREGGLMHIARYEERQTSAYITNSPLFKWGAGKDAPKPKMTPKDYVDRNRASLRSDPDAHAAHLARRRALDNKPKMDPMLAAFFGKASV